MGFPSSLFLSRRDPEVPSAYAYSAPPTACELQAGRKTIASVHEYEVGGWIVLVGEYAEYGLLALLASRVCVACGVGCIYVAFSLSKDMAWLGLACVRSWDMDECC
jgi:hypothetical protein